MSLDEPLQIAVTWASRAPESVSLGPHRYTIEIAQQIGKKRNKLGEADRTRNLIRLLDDQAPSQQRSTLLHEILHQALWQSAVRFLDGFSDELEEAFIVAAEGHLLELFTRPENAPVREWLSS